MLLKTITEFENWQYHSMSLEQSFSVISGVGVLLLEQHEGDC